MLGLALTPAPTPGPTLSRRAAEAAARARVQHAGGAQARAELAGTHGAALPLITSPALIAQLARSSVPPAGYLPLGPSAARRRRASMHTQAARGLGAAVREEGKLQ